MSDFLKDTVNPVYLVTGAAGAGIGQWRNSPREWKQGGRGFGRRFASASAQHIVSDTLLFGSSTLLREDNRYYPSPPVGIKSRIGYALKNTFLARHSDGSVHLSYSRIGSMAGASLISRAWQAPSSAKMSSAAINFGASLGGSMGFSVAHEFLPFLWRRQ